MRRSARLIIVIALLGAAPIASAQVINGESTYEDSDLHQPPTADVPPRGGDRRGASTPTREPDNQ